MSPQDLRLAFVKPMTMHGIKQFPSPEEMEMMRMMITKHYGHLSHGHFHLAFELNVLGTHWEKISPYGMMSAEFIAAVLKAYNEHMRSVWKTLRHKINDHMLELAPVNEEDAVSILMNIIKADHDNPSSATDTIACHMITKLYTRNIINDEWWTDAEWDAFKDQSKRNVHAEGFRIQSPFNWKQLVKNERIYELKRLLYRDLLGPKYEKLMQKMEEI